MDDIEFKTETKKFKYRVNGIVIYNNKLLTIKMKNNISYCLPGGHVELGEDTKTAILREMLEELDTPVSIDKELAFVENFYLDKKGFETHELGFYYIVKPDNFEKIPFHNYSRTENDKGEIKIHNFEWLEISSLKDFDFKPEFLKNKLINEIYDFEHIIKIVK
jgi:8-oxo-dGTP pyrophosphatase MutT (NUDIX family)